MIVLSKAYLNADHKRNACGSKEHIEPLELYN